MLTHLNPAQKEAVVNYQSPSLIVAGAGSGKTRVLTTRIAYMIAHGVSPDRILAMTFTNKAAREMRERILHMIPDLLTDGQARRIWMGTFHSIFSRILRMEAQVLGFPATYTIYDTADSRNLIRRIIKERRLDDEVYRPGDVLSRISLAKNNLVTPQAYEANAQLQQEDAQLKRPEVVHIYKEYARRCKEYGAMDFDDLLLNINILFRDHPAVLAKYQERFQYILVDEYQDTNYAQYVIVRRLAQNHARICVVGDDAQSIYSFRGAKIENILRFRSDFPEAQTFKLEQNYRSTRTIVSAANSVIAHNEKRLPKESFSKGQTGEKIKVLRAFTDHEEASMVADELRRLVRAGGEKWSEAAILYRTNAQSRALEEALRRRSIPYRIYGGTSFYQRKEVKDLVAYIRLVVNPKDEESLRRVINFPARGIGDVTLERIASAADKQGVSMMEVIRDLEGADASLPAAAAPRVKEFAQTIAQLSLAREQLGLYEIGMEIATRSGLLTHYKADSSPEAMSALENIEELLNSMREFQSTESDAGQPTAPTLEEWLQNIALLTDADERDEGDRDYVTLMTVHAAKGLEFKYVAIAGMEENLFPSQMGAGTQEGLEEERRLFYVALTRAKSVAIVAFAQQRFKWGQMTFAQPSRFLKEIDPKFLDIDFRLDEAEIENRKQEPENSRWERPRRSESRVAEVVKPLDTSRLSRVESASGGASSPLKAGPPIAVGTRVVHSKFGVGTVVQSQQMAGDTKLSIAFDEGATRTLLQKFAKLDIL